METLLLKDIKRIDSGIGHRADAAETDPTQEGNLVQLSKGILTGAGQVSDAAETDPTQSASIIALLKGLLTASTPGTASQPDRYSSSAKEETAQPKASAGVLYGLLVANDHTSPVYVQVHNTASTPSASAVPVLSLRVAAGETGALDGGHFGIPLDTGIAVVVSTDLDAYTAVGSSVALITATYK